MNTLNIFSSQRMRDVFLCWHKSIYSYILDCLLFLRNSALWELIVKMTLKWLFNFHSQYRILSSSIRDGKNGRMDDSRQREKTPQVAFKRTHKDPSDHLVCLQEAGVYE
jgi:hypothetical protein